MGAANISRHGSEHSVGQWPVQTQLASYRRLKSQAVTAHFPRRGERQIGRDDWQLCRQRRLDDGLIHRPVRPTAFVPIHRATKARGIVWHTLQMVGDRAGVVKTEHLKTHGGTATKGDQTAHHFGLQLVMVRVVVPLAKEDEISARQTSDETLALDKSGGGDIPDTPGERMIPTQGRLPRRNRAPRQGQGDKSYEPYKSGYAVCQFIDSCLWCQRYHRFNKAAGKIYWIPAARRYCRSTKRSAAGSGGLRSPVSAMN